MNVGHRDTYNAKKIFNYSQCVEVRILVEKLITYEAYILTISLVQTCNLETTSLCLCTCYVYTYSKSTNVNVNMSFPNSNFEGNFSTYEFGK